MPFKIPEIGDIFEAQLGDSLFSYVNISIIVAVCV